ncbi:glycosyltransferase family 2 protein, partial [Romboutsia ilealis]
MRKNLVSIITPMYNSEKFIEATIKSVINQTYKDWEMIIVDDCSTDNSPNIVKPYVENDSRIKYIRVEFNQGVSHARNLALEQANGQFIAFLDSDDIWDEEKLEKQIAFMNDKECAISFTSYELMDENNERLNKII